MQYFALSRLYFVLFLASVIVGYPARFDMGDFFKNTAPTQKKVGTVIVKKKDPRVIAFFKRMGGLVGFAGIFEWIIPRRWKNIFGFSRGSVTTFLTLFVAITNLSLVACFLFHHRALITGSMHSLFAVRASGSPLVRLEQPVAIQEPVVQKPVISEPLKPIGPILPAKPLPSVSLSPNEFE